nr:hypothetical protein HK105_000300 [Polyrhizophydium stewartii]
MSEIAHLRSALERLAVAATHIDHDVAALMSELSAPQVLSESASADLDAFERRWQPAVARQRATVEAVARQLDFGQPAPSAPNADMLARAAEAALAHFQAQTESLKGVLEELGVPDMRELDVRLPPPPPPPAKQPLQLQPYQQPQLEPQPQHHQHPTLHQQPVAASLSDALEAPPIAAMAEPPTPAFAPPPTPAQQPLPSTPVQLRDKRKSSVLSPLSPQTPFGRVLANIASSGALSQIAPSRARFDEIPDSPTLEDLGLSSLSRQMLEGKPQASSASGGASARAARSDAGLSRFESLSLSSARAGSPEIASAAQGRPAIARQPSAASMRLRSAMSMSSIDSPELSEQALPSLTHHIGARNRFVPRTCRFSDVSPQQLTLRVDRR